jgi:hypothetical protein
MRADFLDKTFANDAPETAGDRIGPSLKKATRAPDWGNLRTEFRRAGSATASRALGAESVAGGYALNPPSIVRLAPVTKPASGPAR